MIPNIGLNAVAGKDPKDFGLDPVRFDEMLPGCYEVQGRLADMDLDGVHAQMCFPTFPGFAGGTFFAANDKELAGACVAAWNDFIIDEWCGAAPDRFIPMVMIPFWDVDGLGRRGRTHRGQGGEGHHVLRGTPSPRPALVPLRPLGPAARGRAGRRHAVVPPLRFRAARPTSRPTRTSPSPSRCSA